MRAWQCLSYRRRGRAWGPPAQQEEGRLRVPLETQVTVAAQAVVWLRGLSERARARRAQDASEVAGWLNGVIAQVEREVVRGVRLFCGLLNGLLRGAARAEDARARSAAQRAARQAAAPVSAVRDGSAPLRGNLWEAECVLFVREQVGGGTEVLIRWVGAHDDSWRAYSTLNPALRRCADRWARRKLKRGTGGSHWR
jgi:hypothetical protein